MVVDDRLIVYQIVVLGPQEALHRISISVSEGLQSVISMVDYMKQNNLVIISVDI